MKRIVFLSLLCLSLNALHAADPETDDHNCEANIELQEAFPKAEADALELKDPEKAGESVVPNASFKRSEQDWLLRIVWVFYDADGNQLLKTRDAFRVIDPTAPKPRAQKFNIAKDQFGYTLDLYTVNGIKITTLFLKKRIHLKESKDDVEAMVDLSTLDDQQSAKFKRLLQQGLRTGR